MKEVVVVSKEKDTINAVEKMRDIIKKQTNSKDITILENMTGVKVDVKFDFNKIAPDFKELTPKIIAKLGTESASSILKNIEQKGKHVIKVNGKEVDIVKEYLIVSREVPAPYIEVEFRHGFVYLSTERNDVLEAEGYAREIMRRVQALRKKAGLNKLDRIKLTIALKDVNLEKWKDQIAEKVGAKELNLVDEMAEETPAKPEFSDEGKIKGKELEIGFDKV